MICLDIKKVKWKNIFHDIMHTSGLINKNLREAIPGMHKFQKSSCIQCTIRLFQQKL